MKHISFVLFVLLMAGFLLSSCIQEQVKKETAKEYPVAPSTPPDLRLSMSMADLTSTVTSKGGQCRSLDKEDYMSNVDNLECTLTSPLVINVKNEVGNLPQVRSGAPLEQHGLSRGAWTFIFRDGKLANYIPSK
jgi:hypothetical protein